MCSECNRNSYYELIRKEKLACLDAGWLDNELHMLSKERIESSINGYIWHCGQFIPCDDKVFGEIKAWMKREFDSLMAIEEKLVKFSKEKGDNYIMSCFEVDKIMGYSGNEGGVSHKRLGQKLLSLQKNKINTKNKAKRQNDRYHIYCNSHVNVTKPTV